MMLDKHIMIDEELWERVKKNKDSINDILREHYDESLPEWLEDIEEADREDLLNYLKKLEKSSMPEEEIKRIVGDIYAQAFENNESSHRNMLMKILDPESAYYLHGIAELAREKVNDLEKAETLTEEIQNLTEMKQNLEEAIRAFGTLDPAKVNDELIDLIEENRKIQMERDKMKQELETMREQYDRMQSEMKEGVEEKMQEILKKMEKGVWTDAMESSFRAFSENSLMLSYGKLTHDIFFWDQPQKLAEFFIYLVNNASSRADKEELIKVLKSAIEMIEKTEFSYEKPRSLSEDDVKFIESMIEFVKWKMKKEKEV